jgi:hypothetical protein
MNSLAPLSPVRILALWLFLLLASPLHAQVGDNNPGGHSGIFNGQINTGCSYDPYTGNARRSITDIAVAGAVGEYPLALVRTANSRAPSTTEVFGWAGGWNHNYNWVLEDSPTSNTANFHPIRYTVDFPDGRVETFRAVTWDSVYRVRPGADTPAQSTSAGVRERFLQLNLSTMYAYLILPDGGAVEFKAFQHVANGRYYYKYYATGIYDPHGLKTQLVSSITPDGLRRRLDWVIEPAGRSLHFLYTGPNNSKIDHVDASDGRSVKYYYIYCNGCRLDHVVYYNNANWTARYQYVGSNIGGELPPLLGTADDPMYAGPMKRIGYVYRTVNNPDGTTPVYGQIQSENYYDGTTVGAAVSTLAVGTDGVHTGPGYRRETRGDTATPISWAIHPRWVMIATSTSTRSSTLTDMRRTTLAIPSRGTSLRSSSHSPRATRRIRRSGPQSITLTPTAIIFILSRMKEIIRRLSPATGITGSRGSTTLTAATKRLTTTPAISTN